MIVEGVHNVLLQLHISEVIAGWPGCTIAHSPKSKKGLSRQKSSLSNSAVTSRSPIIAASGTQLSLFPSTSKLAISTDGAATSSSSALFETGRIAQTRVRNQSTNPTARGVPKLRPRVRRSDLHRILDNRDGSPSRSTASTDLKQVSHGWCLGIDCWARW